MLPSGYPVDLAACAAETAVLKAVVGGMAAPGGRGVLSWGRFADVSSLYMHACMYTSSAR